MKAMNGVVLGLMMAVAGAAGTAGTADFQKGLDAYEAGDYATTLREWRPLAEQGDATTQYNLGLMYANGLGVAQDDREAVKWHRLAAEKGLAAAQVSLGVMYDDGRGVPQDHREAVKWYRMAAEKGLARAQYNLGVKYWNGEGVPESDYEAYIWSSLAVAGGSEKAKKLRKDAENRLSRADLAAAQKQANRRFRAIEERKAENAVAPSIAPTPGGNSKDGTTMTLIGDIEPGDARIVQRRIESGNVKTITFDSNGGNLAEGVEIGRLIRQHLIHTHVPAGAKCYSACVFAFVGGVERNVAGLVGIHSFYSEAFLGSENYTAASEVYDLVSAEAEAYIKEMRIPTDLLDHMKRVGHDEIAILGESELESYFLKGVDPVYRQTRKQ